MKGSPLIVLFIRLLEVEVKNSRGGYGKHLAPLLVRIVSLFHRSEKGKWEHCHTAYVVFHIALSGESPTTLNCPHGNYGLFSTNPRQFVTFAQRVESNGVDSLDLK